MAIVISQIFIFITELVIPTEIRTKEEKVEMKTHLLRAEVTTSRCSI